MGYVTFRDYKCLNTENSDKCGCDALRQYVMNHFDDTECDDDIGYETTDNVSPKDGENESVREMWFDMLDDMNDQKILIWIVMGSMVLVVILIMCYLCAMKMA
eukprot:259677_1